MCWTSLLTAGDLDGLRGVYPRWFADFCWESRISMAYITALNAILQWMAIVSAKGASQGLSPAMQFGQKFLWVWFIITGCILPPLETVVPPPETTEFAYGLHNGYINSIKYASNGVLGWIIALGSVVYGWRIFAAMGGNATIKKLQSQTNSTGADLARISNMKRVVMNTAIIALFLWIGASYGLSLLASRNKYCFFFETLPAGEIKNYSYWWSLTNVLLLAMPYMVLFVLALPGQKTNAKKVQEALSTAMSKGGSALSKNSKTTNSSKAPGSTTSSSMNKSTLGSTASAVSSISSVSVSEKSTYDKSTVEKSTYEKPDGGDV